MSESGRRVGDERGAFEVEDGGRRAEMGWVVYFRVDGGEDRVDGLETLADDVSKCLHENTLGGVEGNERGRSGGGWSESGGGGGCTSDGRV